MSKREGKNPFGPIVFKGVKVLPAKHGMKVIQGEDFAKKQMEKARRQAAAGREHSS